MADPTETLVHTHFEHNKVEVLQSVTVKIMRNLKKYLTYNVKYFYNIISHTTE